MPSPDPADRSAVASIAGHESWARTTDRSARGAPGGHALAASFEDKVDPDRVLAPEVRAQMAASARSAHYARLARLAAKSRAANRAAAAEQSA